MELSQPFNKYGRKTNLTTEYQEKVTELLALLNQYVENNRSTLRTKQTNDAKIVL